MQNHRMGKAGSDQWRSSSLCNLPAQAEFPGVYNSGLCPGGFWLSREGDYNLSGKSVPVLSHPHRKEVLHHIQVEHIPFSTHCISSWDWDWKLTEGELFLNSICDGAWPFLVEQFVWLIQTGEQKTQGRWRPGKSNWGKSEERESRFGAAALLQRKKNKH